MKAADHDEEPLVEAVIHITQSFGAGVLTQLDSISRRQVEAGARVTIVHTRRADTPTSSALRARFDPRVELVELTGRLSSLPRLFLDTGRRYVRSDTKTAIHLHSSAAGVFGRGAIALIPTRNRAAVFYSPHGFSFLRQDVRALTRRLFRLVERVMSPIGDGLILLCPSEQQLAQQHLCARSVHVVQSGVRSETVQSDDELTTALERRTTLRSRPLVVTVGRLTYARAPWRFAAVARELHQCADFLWIGEGLGNERAEWIADAPVEVTGWLDQTAVEELLRDADVFLFPSLWEGKSLALIQAQAAGLPAVVTDVIGNRDTVLDGVTGFICADDTQLIARVRQLIQSRQLRHALSLQAVAMSRTLLTDDNIGRETLRIYAGALPTERTAQSESPVVAASPQ